ncbi:hypothetical protein AURDEDRAFT_59112 [Auricularia subglabra TFB-10046 SS5]|nr:hypothetical protein AURDEDRAFT_59112 [Auricularia subglabra TFB-10046 SS5]
MESLSLWSLQDGVPGEKPPYPYPTLILCALKGSPKGKLTLEEMYKAIEDRFPFYSTYKPYRVRAPPIRYDP